MQAKSTIASDLNLHPIPGPDPVDLTIHPWWLWLVPAVLLTFLWFWWSRKKTPHQLNRHERLEAAIWDSQNTLVPPRERFEHLHQALRDFLSSFDPRWKVLSAAESLPACKRLFPEHHEFASMLYEKWIAAENILFSPVEVAEKDVADYALYLGMLHAELDKKDESKKTGYLPPNGTKPVVETNN